MSERRNNGDLVLDRSSALNVVRTEHQLASHDGFRPEALVVDQPVRARLDGSRTLILAVPPAWTETPGKPCVPLARGRLARAHMDKWDTGSELDAALLCAGCPAQGACLVEAVEEERGLSAGNRYLVRGGVTPAGRVRLEIQLGMMEGTA